MSNLTGKTVLTTWDNLKRLSNQIKALKERVDKAEQMISKLASDGLDGCPCAICTYYIQCLGEACPKYESGTFVDDDGIEHKYDCRDYGFGECDIYKGTPCHGCNFEKNFKWNGKVEQLNDAENRQKNSQSWF